MSSRTRRAAFSLVLFFAVCGVAGMLISQKVGAQSSTDESQFRNSLKAFTNAYAIVAQNYAEPLTGDKPDKVIYDGAIPGMLHTLDPHSNLYDPTAYAKMREEEHGKYYGVGMLIQPIDNKIIVRAPYEGTPSFKAGIKPGDDIVAVDGKPTANMNSEQVANMLKGPRGTHVMVTISRQGAPAPLHFDLVRDEIPNPSVDLAFLLKPGVGYIHITQFEETTGREVGDALDSFGNIHGLVLDLRNNPGGLLTEAVATCDKFLKRGQLIVSQRGRAYPEQSYRATHGNDGRHYPIVVLVNRGTASAAEIVSGALQDHDRALIFGETTFGKGLVQTVYQLSDNTGLALTTYHYFTPSGRLIQRNYNGVSLYDYYYNHEPPQNVKDREVKLTDSGRTVYGGGGITPDIKYQAPKPTYFQDDLTAHDVFFNFADFYLSNHTIGKDFQIDANVLNAFKQFLATKQINYTAQDMNSQMDWLKTNIKADMATYEFGHIQGLKTRADFDPEIAKALTYLPQAETLEQTALKSDAEKQSARGGAPQAQ